MARRTLNVGANPYTTSVLTIDEQGILERTLLDLIVHAANRYAAYNVARFFLDVPREGAI